MIRPPLFYRLASAGLALPLAGHALLRALRDGGRDYLAGRFGFAPHLADRPVWFHCASVGEVAAALPLVRAFADCGVGPLLISTATPTGHRNARRQAPAGTRVVYLPIDRPRPMRRFLARIRPRAALILETELWPHLFAALAQRGIPIVLINGRLSARTTSAPAWWRDSARWCLQQTVRILARSQADHDRFLELGAEPARLEAIGNLKFAQGTAEPDPAIPLDGPFIVAASTHDDEERQLALAWRRQAIPGHRLVIVPRHPERGAAIARSLGDAGLVVHRRSRNEAPGESDAIYLADTLGELPGLIAGAEVVVMGGSLIPRGGQNVLEPARAGRPIVTGPHMYNFADETERLRAANALVQADNAIAVMTTVAQLLGDPERRRSMGHNARALIDSEADMAERYRRALVDALPTLASPESV